MHCTSHFYQMTSFLFVTFWILFFYIVEGKDENMDLIENEFIISIYRQAHFKQRSEESILCVYVFQDHSCEYTHCAPTQRICPEVPVAGSYEFIKWENGL